MYDPNCIFCKIAKKEIPSELVYEDSEFVAFFDINPVAKGHTLLVPKDHYRWFTDLPDELYDKLFRKARDIANILKIEHGADFVRLGIVGKDVPHTHIHLIPQKLTDGGPRV